MCFSALHYSKEVIDQLARRNYRYIIDLKPRAETFLNIDLKQIGVGGDNSWGQNHMSSIFRAAKYKFKFHIRLFSKGENPFAV